MKAAEARAALLDRCVEYLHTNGFNDHSLRRIAAGVGTSHRMLIYHFASREGLLTAVVERVEARQRETLAALSDATDPAEVSAYFWRDVSDPGLADAERFFFEVYALALRSPDWSRDFRATVVDAWTGPLTDLLIAAGHPPAEAAVRARLGLATVRGLLLDLLLTDDRRAVEEAAELFGRMLFAK